MKEKIKTHPYFKNNKGNIISNFWDKKEEVFRPAGGLNPYLPSPEIIELVRIAQILRRPILVRGEPGCGKTQLAKSVAFEWHGFLYEENLFEWHIKSTSKAQDGIYTFDHIQRLRDSQLSEEERNRMKINIKEKEKYVTKGPLAEAIDMSNKSEKPPVLLIDEIDKADIDFPNDLLLELDEMKYYIKDTGESNKSKASPPIVFITSNDERELPQAFLRRCLFMWIDFPNKDLLIDIVNAHLPELGKNHKNFVDEAVEKFKEIRRRIDTETNEQKNISTAELLDWLKVYDYDADDSSPSIDADSPIQHYQTLFKTYYTFQKRKELSKTEKNTHDQ